MSQTPPPPAAYPMALDLNAPLEVANWRPLVQWLLAIPHYFVLVVLMIVAFVCEIIALFTILFTTFLTHPHGLWDGIYTGLKYWIDQQGVALDRRPAVARSCRGPMGGRPRSCRWRPSPTARPPCRECRESGWLRRRLGGRCTTGR